MISLKKISDTDQCLGKCNIGVLWRSIVGERLSEKCSPQKIERGVLFIYVLSPSWSHHINALRHDIMKNIREKMGVQIKRVKILNTSYSRSSSENLAFYNQNVKYVGEKLFNTKNLFSRIKDRDLRERLESISSYSLTRMRSEEV
ncbi:MAG TPA: hypothetical protein DEP20_01120 [Fusobacteria bacterium]|nr:hypothetical protein [Fusobacteriota bacterium]|tara:strand:+ start:427 stop:861 length:435 start_codon:yes stop_codon:yes gene_type:complete